MIIDDIDYSLRQATANDMDLIYKWANDPVVRANAFNTAPIPYENHVKWYNNALKDDEILQYILISKDADGIQKELGQIRLNIEGNEAFIDYSIAPDMRGKGLGSRMLILLIDELKKSKCEFDTLIGQVKYTNKASAGAFEKCGFKKEELDAFIEFKYQL